MSCLSESVTMTATTIDGQTKISVPISHWVTVVAFIVAIAGAYWKISLLTDSNQQAIEKLTASSEKTNTAISVLSEAVHKLAARDETIKNLEGRLMRLEDKAFK